MRARRWLVSISMLSSLAAGAWLVACSSDDTAATPPKDSGTGGMDSTMMGMMDTGTGGDAKGDTATPPKDAAPEAACVDASRNVANGDAAAFAGDMRWSCVQAYCAKGASTVSVDGGDLGTCAADCYCNAAINTALNCVADGGDQMTCFVNAITNGGGPVAVSLATCLIAAQPACMVGDAAPTGEGGHEGGGDAGASDAPSDGG
jgi:hypothetical protein